MCDNNSKIDIYRKRHLLIAELIDAWRLIPRAVGISYIWLVAHVTIWYMNLKPYILEGCDVDKLGETCLITSPSTQEAVLLTAAYGLGAAIFAFYTNTGRKWGEGVKAWNNVKTKFDKPKPPTLPLEDDSTQ